MRGCRWMIGLLLLTVLASCSQAGSAIPTPASSASHAVVPTPAPTIPEAPATPTSAATHSPSPARVPTSSPPLPSPTPAPRPVTLKPGDVAVVAADEVRMRTLPSVKAPSQRYTPMLPKGTDLYVIAGPKHGSGYHWYKVSPITAHVTGIMEEPRTNVPFQPIGWVPVADRDGTPWLGHRKVACPPTPRDVAALASLSEAARLACFSRVPITVQARILPCNCSITGPCDTFKPAWFVVTGEYLVIFPPATRSDDVNGQPGVPLLLDPTGAHHDPVPQDQVVTVTGVFDHPAAAGCQENVAEYGDETDPEPVWKPSGTCRTQFAVTSIK